MITDTNGNTRHAFSGDYMTNKWFQGSCTLSTTNLTLTDVDVYHVSFEQLGDHGVFYLEVFDINLFTTAATAEFDGYLYAIDVESGKATVTREASLHVGSDGNTAIANQYERLRRANIGKRLDGTSDGFWVDLHFPNNPSRIEDVTTKVWGRY